jgi:hypothetical protein
MAEDDSDFNDILEGTVDEVKDQIRDLDYPDYEGLIEAEKEGKDRKTIKDFLKSHMDSHEHEAEDSEEVVEEIEEETEGGLLGSYSRTSVLAGGVILGVLLGFAAATYVPGLSSSAAAEANPQEVQENVKTLAGSGSNATVEVSSPEVRNSMYYFNVTITQDRANETATQSQQVYVSLDGQKLFLVREQFGQTLSPIDIPQALERLESQTEVPTEAPSGQGQTPPEPNTTQ